MLRLITSYLRIIRQQKRGAVAKVKKIESVDECIDLECGIIVRPPAVHFVLYYAYLTMSLVIPQNPSKWQIANSK